MNSPNRLDLYYLGERDYVNGLTLFEEMIQAYMESTGDRPLHIKKFQVTKWVRTDASLEVWETAELTGNRRAREAAVRIDLLSGEAQTSLLLFPQLDSPVDSRLKEYDRAAYVARSEDLEEGRTQARLADIDGMVDWLRAVVEVNHQFVTRQAAELGVHKGISWAYLLQCPYLSDSQARACLDIAYGDLKTFDAHGNRYFVRTLTAPGLTTANTRATEMCFFIPYPPKS